MTSARARTADGTGQTTAPNLNYFELDNIPTGLYGKVIDEFDSKEL
jgi:hypothetical protein